MFKHRVLLWALAGFLAGVALCSFFVLGPMVLWSLALAGSLCLLIRRGRFTIAGVIMLAVFVGAWRTTNAFHQTSPLRDIAGDKQTVTLEGVAASDFSLSSTGGHYTFRVLRMDGTAVDDCVEVFGADWVRPRWGQELTITGKLQLPKNSSDFDYASYLAKDGTHALMYFPTYGVPDEALSLPWSVRFIRPLYVMRDALASSILRAVPQPESAYLNGILVGTRGTITNDLTTAFANTGTSHILAISGYNITIVAAALMALLAPLGKRRSYWLVVCGVLAFTLMVGAGASVVRAAIMGILGLTAVQLGRRQDAGTGILLAAAVMCAFNPLFLRWDVGFQLSFLALVGIVYIEPLMAKTIPSVMATTIAANIFVLPLIVFDFGTLALYTLPANLIVLPLVPLAMALGFATGIAGIILPFLGSLVGQLAWLVAAFQIAVIRFFGALPYASLSVALSVPALVAFYAGLVAWLAAVYCKRTWPPNAHSSSSSPIASSAR